MRFVFIEKTKSRTKTKTKMPKDIRPVSNKKLMNKEVKKTKWP
jgi:hypothetical protein